MNPTPAQVFKAHKNHYRPSRTLGGRIKDVLDHVQITERQKSASNKASMCFEKQASTMALVITAGMDQ
jgi:hypothetical protein